MNLRIQEATKPSQSASFEAHREIRVEFLVAGEFVFNFEIRSYPISSAVVALEKLVKDPWRFIETFEFKSTLENILFRHRQDRLVRIGAIKVLDIDGESTEDLSLNAKLRLSLDLVAHEKCDLSILEDAIEVASRKLFFMVGGFTKGAVLELLTGREFSLEFIARDI